MEQIKSKNGSVSWNVIKVSSKTEGRKRKTQRAVYTVACELCGYQTTNVRATIEKRKKCPGCSKKPVALKTDKTGACVSICKFGLVEYVKDYQEQHGVSEREAVRQFVDTAKAKLSPDDPMQDSITEGSVHAKVRRLTGKKHDQGKSCGGLLQNETEKIKKYRIEAEVTAVQTFLENHLPDYILTRRVEQENQEAFSLTPTRRTI